MTLAWYRKWRPQQFSDVVGQDHIVQTLNHAIQQNATSHAYLFTGPRGVGKTTLARLLAKSVNCVDLIKSETGVNPCNKCELCNDFNHEALTDVFEIDAASNRGIDDIRALRDTVAFSPVKGKFKIYIIDEVHMLSKDAFNALLKTLEEPPEHVIFILATTDVQKIPATILSRCQRFDFNPLTIGDLQKHILQIAKSEKIDITEDGANVLAEAATGSGRDAVSLLQQMSVHQTKIDRETVEKLLGFMPMSHVSKLLQLCREGKTDLALDFVRQLLDGGGNAEQCIRAVLRLFSIALNNREKSDWAEGLSVSEIITGSDQWAWALNQVAKHPEPFLVLATAVVGCSTNWGKGVGVDSDVRPPSVEAPASAPVVEQSPKSKPTEEIHTVAVEKWHPGQSEKQLWDQFIEAAKPFNHSLASLLRDADLLGVTDGDPGKITIGLRFPFHRERIMEAKNRRILGDILKQITGKDFQIECAQIADTKNKSMVKAEDVSKAAEEIFTE
ncbi:MAG: DNA polymerase III subunit gamma/tau [Patescibacteria group bacterium]|jgi:DNA polymerase-3 subunit gamma/tau